MARLRTVVVLLGVAMGGGACGIKGSPRPPEAAPPLPPPSSETPPPPPSATQSPQGTQRGPLPPSTPPPDAGTP